MGYTEIVRKMIKEANVVLEVIDARFPVQSRNTEMENFVKHNGKKLLIVINKSDLVGKKQAERIKKTINEKSVFVSALKKKGGSRLRTEIMGLAQGEKAKVGIIGYPNTGKSSVINMLKGRKNALTSPTAGFTKGTQFVRINKQVMLIDSPGVIPLQQNDETLMALLSSKNPQQLKDLEGTGIEVAQILIDNDPGQIEKVYGVKATDGEELLEKLAIAKKRLLKAGKPDLNAAATILIVDFQNGKIRLK